MYKIWILGVVVAIYEIHESNMLARMMGEVLFVPKRSGTNIGTSQNALVTLVGTVPPISGDRLGRTQFIPFS